MSEQAVDKDAAATFIRALVGAWDCCGTCAGGLLAKRDQEQRARAWGEVIEAVEAMYPPLNYELRYDGTEDPISAAYVEAFREVSIALDQFRTAASSPDPTKPAGGE